MVRIPARLPCSLITRTSLCLLVERAAAASPSVAPVSSVVYSPTGVINSLTFIIFLPWEKVSYTTLDVLGPPGRNRVELLQQFIEIHRCRHLVECAVLHRLDGQGNVARVVDEDDFAAGGSPDGCSAERPRSVCRGLESPTSTAPVRSRQAMSRASAGSPVACTVIPRLTSCLARLSRKRSSASTISTFIRIDPSSRSGAWFATCFTSNRQGVCHERVVN